MDFARKQLEKYGWKDGQGLGKNENGIAEALKPQLKFDNSGVGHKIGEQFTNNWWERVFNSAAQNIEVEIDEDGAVLMQQRSADSVEISTKNYSIKDLKKNNNLQYGSFLKTAKLTEAGIENYEVALPKHTPNLVPLTDDELLAACGGRTAHKGARHGLKLTGKLSRIEKQEKMLMKRMKNVSLLDDAINIEKKAKKIKKQKEIADNSEAAAASSRKKHKKKRKSVTFNEDPTINYYSPEPDLDSSFCSSKDENSSEAFPDANANNIFDEGIEQDLEDTNSERSSDSHKSFEEVQTNLCDLSKAERKKLKKKRKMKEGATEKFMDQCREEENVKKRKLQKEEKKEQKKSAKHSKKTKYGENSDLKKSKKIANLVESMGHNCRISDDE